VIERVLAVLLAACVAASVALAAQSPFIGEWQLDSAKSRTPDEMKVESKGGSKYVFNFGGGAEEIVADGIDQQGLYGSLLSVKEEAPDTWIVSRKMNGKLILKATWKLSADGKTLTDYYREFESDGSTLSMDYVYERTGQGSGFAGDWQSVREMRNTPYFIQVKAFEGDGLSFITAAEKRTKSVKFDGKEYPNEGPNGGRNATSSARQVNERNLVITDKVDGKVAYTEDVSLSADSKTLTITLHFPGREKPNVMVFNRK
jgi:hypothetical protein